MSILFDIILDISTPMCYASNYKMSLLFLQTFGLSKPEIELYELLLKTGEAPIHVLLQKTTYKRPTLYHYLDTLEKKGLVKTRDFKKKIHFKPTSPIQLLELAQKEEQKIAQAKQDLQTIMPIISSSYILSVQQPVVRTYEGVEGLKEIYEDTLKEKQYMYAVLQTEDMDQDLLEWLKTDYAKKRKRLKIPSKAIISQGRGATKFTERDIQEFRISRLVPPTLFPFQHEVLVYGDKVAFIHYKKGDALIGVVIKHPAIAQTMKAWFDLAWQGAEKYKKA